MFSVKGYWGRNRKVRHGDSSKLEHKELHGQAESDDWAGRPNNGSALSSRCQFPINSSIT